jgi:hypothetical protein
MRFVRYRRAVEKLQALAEACESVKHWPPEDPFLVQAYVFGRLVAGDDPVDTVEVVLMLNLPPEEVTWGSNPRGTAWLANTLRLDTGGFAYCWRSYLDPPWNHHVREPVQFWSSQRGPDHAVLRALAERRLHDLPRPMPSPQDLRDQRAGELRAALAHLRAVQSAYGDRDWRRDHRQLGRYPENELWEAVQGYLELRDAADTFDAVTDTK